MTSWLPGRKYEHVVAPLPFETGTRDGGSSPRFIRKMRSQLAVAGRACKMSSRPSNDQYASAFSPPGVSWRKSERCSSCASDGGCGMGEGPDGAGRGGGTAGPHDR